MNLNLNTFFIVNDCNYAAIMLPYSLVAFGTGRRFPPTLLFVMSTLPSFLWFPIQGLRHSGRTGQSLTAKLRCLTLQTTARLQNSRFFSQNR